MLTFIILKYLFTLKKNSLFCLCMTCVVICILFCFCSVLEIEPRASSMLSTPSITKLPTTSVCIFLIWCFLIKHVLQTESRQMIHLQLFTFYLSNVSYSVVQKKISKETQKRNIKLHIRFTQVSKNINSFNLNESCYEIINLNF